MTYAPATISALAALWVANGGENLGIVGDASHAATGGYHEGKDDLAAAGVLATDYSVQQARDKAGLTNAAAALDLGKLNGSLANLQAFSRWLVAQCQAGAPGTSDVREVIYSPDGQVVKRWSGVDGLLHDGWPTGTGNGDSTHLWHTHISFFRDSEGRSKTDLFAPYFAGSAPPAGGGTPVAYIRNAALAPGKITVGPAGATGWSLERGSDGPVGAGDVYDCALRGDLVGANIAGGVVPDCYIALGGDGLLYAYPAGQVSFSPATTSGGDCQPAIDAAIAADRKKAHVKPAEVAWDD